MREAYRLQKDLLGGGHDVLFSYSSAEVVDFETIRTEIAALLNTISSK